jgi:hypothetical protein
MPWTKLISVCIDKAVKYSWRIEYACSQNEGVRRWMVIHPPRHENGTIQIPIWFGHRNPHAGWLALPTEVSPLVPLCEAFSRHCHIK